MTCVPGIESQMGKGKSVFAEGDKARASNSQAKYGVGNPLGQDGLIRVSI